VRALTWGLAGFLAIQLSISAVLERLWPELRDVEAAIKLRSIRRRVADDPGRPLIVFLGSSRGLMGFRPDLLDAYAPPDGPRPVVYNYAHTGYGPKMELAALQRLLATGIRPDWVVIEVHPGLLNQRAHWREEVWLAPARLGLADVRTLGRFADDPWRLWGEWLLTRLTPAHDHRFFLLRRLMPCWLAWEARAEPPELQFDRNGFAPYGKKAVSGAEFDKELAFAHLQYYESIHNFQIATGSAAALRELLAECRHHDIRALLLTLPEGSIFQGWYAPSAWRQVEELLTGICYEYDASWVDARSWVPDHGFFDSHHLLPHGAVLFTERFGREVFRPLARGGFVPPPPGPWARSVSRAEE
jgi:hypothetical protein